MEQTSQMSIKTIGHELAASVSLPGSKSISNRCLLLAALAEGVSTLTNIQISDDALVFVEALKALGFNIRQVDGSSCVVTGSGGHIPNDTADVWASSLNVAKDSTLCTLRRSTLK